MPTDTATVTVGRFAPSPTGRLHVGNLRTALIAWLAVKAGVADGSAESAFLLRFEDLDTQAVRAEHYQSQEDDLRAIGLDWHPVVLRQSERMAHYEAALKRLTETEQVYPCFCSRKEIREAASAPNMAHAGHRYPGTCCDLSSVERSQRAEARDPALRVRADGVTRGFTDLVRGPAEFAVDDFVVRRNDGTPAYHLVVVVDDAAQNVDLVVRADDLLESTSRHLLLYELLELSPPRHAHVPLVLAPNGDRLAKRHGAVNLSDRAAAGESPAEVLRFLASTLNLCDADETVDDRPIGPLELIERFDYAALPHRPLHLAEDYLKPDRSPHRN